MIFTDIVTTTPSVVLAVSLGYRAVTRAPARPGAGAGRRAHWPGSGPVGGRQPLLSLAGLD